MAKLSTPYAIEKDGQIDFFDNYNIPYDTETGVLSDNTDGVYNGNIFEFKLNISNLNKTVFQAIKYLSSMRIKGKSIPATIMLVSLNDTTVYVYRSEDYREDIHKVYIGSASKNNDGFIAKPYDMKLDYSEISASATLRHLIKDTKTIGQMYMPIDIDEDCIVGWARRYYAENPKANKGDFIGDETGTQIKITGEIREPKHFKGLINPYKGKTNEKFKYLMDCLNDRLSKKDLGAFYTPKPYCEKAAELVKMAVDRVPKGNDYIILDRCAGTGNLEDALIGVYDKNGSELITHCIVSTYEYYEYKVLAERFANVGLRDIIPPTEKDVKYSNGRVGNADAMSEEYINSTIIRKWIDECYIDEATGEKHPLSEHPQYKGTNGHCSIILFENPPYQDSIAIGFVDATGKRAKTKNTVSFVNAEYRKHSICLNEGVSSARDISNLFIWSGIHYYLRRKDDAYIIFSPVKYFKNIGLCDNLEFIDGYLFNRKHFHASESSISCCLWMNNKTDAPKTDFSLECYDIDKSNNLILQKTIGIKKSRKTFEPWFDRRVFPDDAENFVWCNREGVEASKDKADVKSVYNPNIIGEIGAPAFSIDSKNRCLVRCTYYHHGFGFRLRKDAYMNKLPLWVAKMFPQDNWYDKDVYNTTSDGGDLYTKDNQFLKSCLIYTCLSNQNKCLSFVGSDGRTYQNELCFDDSKKTVSDSSSIVEKLPIALKDLNGFTKNKDTLLDDDEKELLSLWNDILKEARNMSNYNEEYNYGVYQITKELNTFDTDEIGKKHFHNPTLNGHLISLRVKLKEYYKSHITEKMFQYELLK